MKPVSHATNPAYTLHPTPYTLHPTPYTLHPTPYAQHPTPYILHFTPYTLQPSTNAPHPTPCTLHPACLSRPCVPKRRKSSPYIRRLLVLVLNQKREFKLVLPFRIPCLVQNKKVSGSQQQDSRNVHLNEEIREKLLHLSFITDENKHLHHAFPSIKALPDQGLNTKTPRAGP